MTTTKIEKPIMPEFFRKKTKLTDEELQRRDKYFADSEKWKKKAAVKGRAYSPKVIYHLINKTNRTLETWLRDNNAPSEILTLARHLTHAEFLYLTYSDGLNWRYLPDYSAVGIYEIVSETRPALDHLHKLHKQAGSPSK